MTHPFLASFNLSLPGATITSPMPELTGGVPSVRSRCRITRNANAISISLLADDPDPLALISSAPTGQTDQYLYEEDILQLAIAWPGQASYAGFLLINPHGNRKAVGEATAWPTTQHRGDKGWIIKVTIPLPDPTPTAMGVSALRFFRGVNHEVHALGQSGPHPVDTARMAVISLVPGDADAAGERFRIAAQRAKDAYTAKQVANINARIAACHSPDAPRANRATLESFVTARLLKPVVTDIGNLCWNEQYFINTLIDLWEITHDHRWLEAAIPRIEQVFATRADRTGTVPQNWNAVLPTWYDSGKVYWAMPLITGVILWPIARLIRIANTMPGLESLAARIHPWVALCDESIAIHDREWIDLPEGRGNYLEWDFKGPRRVYPSGGSRICPLNRSNFLGMVMLDLARATGRDDYLVRATKLARFFRQGCETLPDGQLVWEYLHTRYATTGEDLSHASCQVFFAEALHRDGIVFTEADLRAIAATLSTIVFQHGDVPTGTLRGFYPQLNIAVGGHCSLTRFVPHVLPKIVAVVETAMAEGTVDFATQGWGMRIIAQIEKARNAIGPCATPYPASGCS